METELSMNEEKEVYYGWKFPCIGKVFSYDNNALGILQWRWNRYLQAYTKVYKLKIDMPDCPCGRHCLPERVKITVEYLKGDGEYGN